MGPAILLPESGLAVQVVDALHRSNEQSDMPVVGQHHGKELEVVGIVVQDHHCAGSMNQGKSHTVGSSMMKRAPSPQADSMRIFLSIREPHADKMRVPDRARFADWLRQSAGISGLATRPVCPGRCQ